MRAEDVKASYARQIHESGELVKLRRVVPIERDYGLASEVEPVAATLDYQSASELVLRQIDHGLASEPVVSAIDYGHVAAQPEVLDYGLASEPIDTSIDFGLVDQDAFDVTVMARIIPTFAPSDVVAAVQQVGRKAIICADDVDASTFPLPFKAKSDRMVLSDGREFVIGVVDDTTRRVSGQLIAYEMDLKGA